MSGLTTAFPESSLDEELAERTAPELLTVADLLSALGVGLSRSRPSGTGRLRPRAQGDRHPGSVPGRDSDGAIEEFAARRTLGFVLGGGAWIRLAPGLVRIPDVSFIRWDRLPERQVPREPMPDLVPELVVEFFKAGSSHRELERKRREYFAAGVRLVWYVDPTYRAVTVYTGLNESRVLSAKDTLYGGDDLLGFAMSIEDWFAKARGPGKQD
jgi:Uma2 family endonuclease